MKNQSILFLAILVIGGCRSASGSPTTGPTVRTESLTASAFAAGTEAGKSKTATPPATTASASPAPDGDALAPFIVDLSQPFSDITLTEWKPTAYGGMTYALPVSSSDLANLHVIDGLTSAERAYLWKNGFVIIHSREDQFTSLRESVDGGQPYFLTVDAAYHALHQNFDDTLKALERDYIRPRMLAVLQATLADLSAHGGEWKGTSIDAEGTQSVAYLSVAVKLFDPTFEVDPSVRDIVDQQIQQILAGNGWGASSVVPGFTDDYGAYKPVGHYAGDPDLENYFRGMTWLGRVQFLLSDKSRVPLIITLALRRADLDGNSASVAWGEIHRILDFIVGPSDDPGPLEYAALMDRVYGNQQTYAALADDSKWQVFLSRADELPAPQINSLLVKSTTDLAFEKGWRFMGQRFTIDAFIFQNLINDRVPGRKLPTGLDVMAVFGSGAARTSLTDWKLDAYPEYGTQLAKLVKGVNDQPASQWTNRFYTSWLYSFFPLLEPKGAAFPPFMNSPAWGYKEMNSGLGSWAELKHDTILYTKMAEAAGGGGPPGSGPAPAFVEPDPNAFYRMAYAARALTQGLVTNQHLMSATDSSTADVSLGMLLQSMGELGDTLEGFGNLAAKEIQGVPLSEGDYSTLWQCLSLVECATMATPSNRPTTETPPVPVVAAVAGYTDRDQSIVLEVGVGFVDRIFVVVPLEGKLQIAQGGVFTYYEFAQPRENRLTDQQWREQLVSGSPPALPKWAPQFVLTGGKPTHWTIFKIHDWYTVTTAGDGVDLRQNPSKSAALLTKISTGSYINIIDGPVQADGYTWWKIDNSFNPDGGQGWIVENQEWYMRV